MASKLEAFAKKQGIEYFLFNFTDLRGVQRSKLVPAAAAPGAPPRSTCLISQRHDPAAPTSRRRLLPGALLPLRVAE